MAFFLGRLLGEDTSESASMAWWVLLDANGSADGIGGSSYGNDAIELLVGCFSEHDDTGISSVWW
jgi:hypothetical protein